MCRPLLYSTFGFLSLFPGAVLAQSPVFVTETPLSGNSGNTFFVFLPVFNAGAGAATNMQLTSVAITRFGLTAANVLQPGALPFVTGSGYLGPTGLRKLDLEFDNSTLLSGMTYLVKVNGTYEVNGTRYGFALNRPVVYNSGFAGTHQQVLDFILAKFESLSDSDPQAESKALLAFMSGLPQISGAAIGAYSPNIGATFADDGEKIVILNNVKPPTLPLLSSPPSSSAVIKRTTHDAASQFPNSAPAQTNAEFTGPTELPASNQVRLLNGFGAGWDNPVPQIMGWLSNSGYEPVQGTDASVDALRNVGGDGVLYIRSHGAASDNTVEGNIWTSTPTSATQDAALKLDVKSGLVIDAETKYDHYDPNLEGWVGANHWAITPDFIAVHWQNFAANSFVYIDTCESDPANGHDIRDGIFAKIASVYAGWTKDVGDSPGANTARLVFDRLLGADGFCPENGIVPCVSGPASPPAFAQRPFDYTQIGPSPTPGMVIDLQEHQLGYDADYNSSLNFEVNTGSFGILAPSISYVAVDDSLNPPQVFIVGSFGSSPGSVTVGGASVTLSAPWSNSLLVGNLPASLYGDLIVTVNQHNSNVARLTRWEGDFVANVSGLNTLKQTLDFHLVFRSDIRQYRPVIHNPPMEPTSMSAIYANPASEAQFTCSGTATTNFPNETDTYKWTGVANLVPSNQANSGSPNDFAMIAAFFDSHNQMQVTALQTGTNGNFFPCSQEDDYTIFVPPSEGTRMANLPICFPFQNVTIRLDNNANIQPGTVPLPSNSCTWPTGFSTGTFRWPSITAVAAPDPTSAR